MVRQHFMTLKKNKSREIKQEYMLVFFLKTSTFWHTGSSDRFCIPEGSFFILEYVLECHDFLGCFSPHNALSACRNVYGTSPKAPLLFWRSAFLLSIEYIFPQNHSVFAAAVFPNACLSSWRLQSLLSVSSGL